MVTAIRVTVESAADVDSVEVEVGVIRIKAGGNVGTMAVGGGVARISCSGGSDANGPPKQAANIKATEKNMGRSSTDCFISPHYYQCNVDTAGNTTTKSTEFNRSKVQLMVRSGVDSSEQHPGGGSGGVNCGRIRLYSQLEYRGYLVLRCYLNLPVATRRPITPYSVRLVNFSL